MNDMTARTQTDVTRTQINVRMTPRHREMLTELGNIYGTESAALKMAIEFMYVFTFPEALAAAATAFENATGQPDPLGDESEDDQD